MENKINILFVCLGNICRSPVAEGSFRHIVNQRGIGNYFYIDSAGTSSFHAGEPPNIHARQVAKKYGIILEGFSRGFQKSDFEKFQYIFAMDHNNHFDILAQTENEDHKKKVALFRQFDPTVQQSDKIPDVPDPYYGGVDGFDTVQNIALRTSENLLNWLISRHKIFGEMQS